MCPVTHWACGPSTLDADIIRPISGKVIPSIGPISGQNSTKFCCETGWQCRVSDEKTHKPGIDFLTWVFLGRSNQRQRGPRTDAAGTTEAEGLGRTAHAASRALVPLSAEFLAAGAGEWLRRLDAAVSQRAAVLGLKRPDGPAPAELQPYRPVISSLKPASSRRASRSGSLRSQEKFSYPAEMACPNASTARRGSPSRE
jgi:hypothetical protein